MAKKKPKKGAKGKIGATDIPSWVAAVPNAGESGKDFAKRVMDGQYGEGNWSDTGPRSEYSKIKKWANRHFKEP
jgi:hypothetical protein